MTRWRKKPVEVDAYQLTEKTEIKTREGTLFGYPGDWLITGIQGEIYPCGDEIFKATYELADQQSERDNVLSPTHCPVCGAQVFRYFWCIDRDCGWNSRQEEKGKLRSKAGESKVL